MPIEYICEGCGQRKSGIWIRDYLRWTLPPGWVARYEVSPPPIACSDECIQRVERARYGDVHAQ